MAKGPLFDNNRGDDMYESFQIKNFRGFKELTMRPLARVNLVAGKNNIGKTTLLEALWLHHGPNRPDLGGRVDMFRGMVEIDPNELLLDLFYEFDRERKVELSAKGAWGNGSRTLEISLRGRQTIETPVSEAQPDTTIAQISTSTAGRASEDEVVFRYTTESGEVFTSSGWIIEGETRPGLWVQSFQTQRAATPKRPLGVYLAARHQTSPRDHAERFGQLERIGVEREVVEILKGIEPRLSRLTVIPTRGSSAVFGDIGLGRLIPVSVMGDGMARLLALALAIGVAREGGMVLVDEIENGLHHTVMARVWSGIARLVKRFDVQLFATTHNWESIKAADEAFQGDIRDDFRLHRLERMKDATKAVTYDREALTAAMAAEFEVR